MSKTVVVTLDKTTNASTVSVFQERGGRTERISKEQLFENDATLEKAGAEAKALARRYGGCQIQVPAGFAYVVQ